MSDGHPTPRRVRCRLGLHVWTSWDLSREWVVGTPPILAAFGAKMADAPAQERRCEMCGKLEVQQV